MSVQARIRKALEEGKITPEQLAYSYFPSYVAMQFPSYEFAAHNQMICEALMAVEAGRIKRLMICMPPRHGKCLADSTPVLTPDGWRKHGELQVGDAVFGPDGRPTKIVYRSQADLCDLEIVFSNGECIKTNRQHLWTVYDRSAGKWRTLETQQLLKRVWYGVRGKRGSRRRWKLPDCKCLEFTKKQLPMHPYVLGAWLGDGSTGTCRMAHHIKDTEVIDAIVSCGYVANKRWIQPDTGVGYAQFSDKRGIGSKFYCDLKDAGVLFDKHIPEIYLRSDRNQREQLLAGLIDTDGSVEADTGRVRFSTCSPTLRDGVFDLATTLGFRPYIVTISPTVSSSGIVGKKTIYQVCFQPTRTLPARIPRKQIKVFAARHKISIDTIRPAAVAEVGHCIKVDRADGLYVAGKQSIVTHNTMLTSEFFPAWYLGRNPDHQIIASSYSFDRANDVGKKVRNQLIDPLHQTIFPDCTISQDSKAANKLSTDQGGNYYSVGIGGATVGRGAHLFLVDDPIKSREVANSEAGQKRIIDWYRSVAYTRLMPTNAIVVIMTRWHFYDLVGYLLEESGSDWHVLSLPAIAVDDNDLLGRKEGEALWSSRYPIKTLMEIQGEVGTIEWNAQYQQSPLPAGGGMVELGWFQRYDSNQVAIAEVAVRMGGVPKVPFGITQIICSWDTAFKESQLNDPSSCTVWGVAKDQYYLLNVLNRRMKYPELKKTVINTYEHYLAWGLGPPRVLVEDKASGQSLIQDIKNETRIPIIAMKADANKQTRLSSGTPLIEAGKVSLPDRASWLVRYETQMAQFPFGKEDDDVDSTSQFLNWAGRPRFIRSKLPKFWK